MVIDPGGAALPPATTEAAPRPAGEPGLADAGPVPVAGPAAGNYVPAAGVLVPSSPRSRAAANLQALELVRRLEAAGRGATRDEQHVLARWSGWGAVPHIFDPRKQDWAEQHERLRALLSEQEYAAAASSTLNAHYTDPQIAQAMWAALGRAGFSGGRVLEPGCGSGNFIACAPEGAVMVGVENDPVTARVAALLYPAAQIRAEGFEHTRVPDNSFAATVGNVPFGRFALHDPVYNRGRHSIHNHFLVKSLALTAPGGYVAAITSHWTMDAADEGARRALARDADLVAAVRLPSRAHQRTAGTDVVTDILVLRKRGTPRGEGADMPLWVGTGEVLADHTDDGAPAARVRVNHWFTGHPEHVLGEIKVGRGQFTGADLVVVDTAQAPLAERVGERLTGQVDRAVAAGQGLTARPEHLATVPQAFDPGLVTRADTRAQVALGTLRWSEQDGGFERYLPGGWAAHGVPTARHTEWRTLLAMRDLAASLVDAQQRGRPPAERENLRAQLGAVYDGYVSRHGPVNRFKWTEPKPPTEAQIAVRMAKLEDRWRAANGTEENGPYGGTVPHTVRGEWRERASEVPPPQKRQPHLDGGLRSDPTFAVVAALEHFDEEKQTARKAPLFTRDVVTARVPRTRADTPAEAVALSVEQTGTVSLTAIARLLGTTEPHARAQLGGVVFPDPARPDRLIPAASYLSGHVRDKLAAARAAAKTDPAFTANVAALEKVVPADVGPADIRVRPGAPWIGPAHVRQFVKDTFAVDVAVEHAAGQWVVGDKNSWVPTAVREEWGTWSNGCGPLELLEAACNSRKIEVRRPAAEVERDGGDPVDMKATIAAQAKAEKISEHFARWVWTDPARTEELLGQYNHRFNSLVTPRYDGQHLSLPGLSDEFAPHPHQRDAVARVVAEPAVLLDHVVGAGKTGAMFMSAMELGRLGLVRQPWIVVPNHLLEQFGREAKQWYPAARVLMGKAATTAEDRRLLIAQTATSEWDMVIVPQSTFGLISVDPAAQADWLDKQLATLRSELGKASTSRTVKQLESAIKGKQSKLEKLIAQGGKDTGMRFEDSGCDYLFVDEAHDFKNLDRTSNIEELSLSGGSGRAMDLFMKLELLRQRRRDEARAAGPGSRDTVERVATFATGTPVANSLAEMWVMQKYLRPDLLAKAGVESIDDWGATFCAAVTTVEPNATGTKLRSTTRVGKFVNLPELLQLTRTFTDVVTREQVPVPLPELQAGQRQVVTIQLGQEARDFITDLAHRADTLTPSDPATDNNLKIAGDGRNVSLDPRLAGLDAPLGGGRATAVADQIMAVEAKTRGRTYRNEDGSRSAGALQIVFCDRATPKTDGSFTMYDAIKDELVSRGMDPARIRFIHDAAKPADKLALQQACRAGRVSALIGSTQKMGTGLNVQNRAVALHHVDVPWRPGDLEQREGRIMRQGNQNATVDIFTYAAEGSYDTTMWAAVERKALFINQTKTGDLGQREVEDLTGGDIGNAAAATKAAATGDQDYVRRAELSAEVKRLDALARAHADAMFANSTRQRWCEGEITATVRGIAALEPVAADREHWNGRFELRVGGRTYTDRADAAAPFAEALRAVFRTRAGLEKTQTVAVLNGVGVVAARELTSDRLHVSAQVPSRTVVLDRKTLFDGGSEHAPVRDHGGPKDRGLLTRATNMVGDLSDHLEGLREHLADTQEQLSGLRATHGKPFEGEREFEVKRAELRELDFVIARKENSAEAVAAREAAAERMAEAGRAPGWSLLLNPTPKVLREHGYRDTDHMRGGVRTLWAPAAAEYASEIGTGERYSDRPDITPGHRHKHHGNGHGNGQGRGEERGEGHGL